MKKKIISLLILVTSLLVCSACVLFDETESQTHTHEYSEIKNDETHHWLECICGEKMEKSVHNYGLNKKCLKCDYRCPTKGLEYELSADGKYYILSGVGAVEDTIIVLPDKYNGLGVKEIGVKAFSNCENITSVFIPEGVTRIGGGAFQDCRSLLDIFIPTTVSVIEELAFFRCRSLANVYISDVTAWCAIDFLGNEEANPLTRAKNLYVNDVLTTDLIISSDVKRIKKYAFTGSGLTSVVIPNSVTRLEDDVFNGCKNLRSIVLPEGIATIPNRAFLGCEKLESITIPKSVTSIEAWAFSDCFTLKEMVIPDSVTQINTWAFSGCESLRKITIGKRVASIGQYVFSYCNSLETVIFKNSNGWKATLTEETNEISSADLVSGERAAEYLKDTYVAHVWTRADG